MPFPEIYRHVKQLQPNCLMSDYNQGRFPAPALYYTDVKQYEQHAGQTIPTGSEVPSQSATTLQSDWFWKLDYPTQELRSVQCAPLQSDFKRGTEPGGTVRPECVGPAY